MNLRYASGADFAKMEDAVGLRFCLESGEEADANNLSSAQKKAQTLRVRAFSLEPDSRGCLF
jgi:hypothetical protein